MRRSFEEERYEYKHKYYLYSAINLYRYFHALLKFNNMPIHPFCEFYYISASVCLLYIHLKSLCWVMFEFDFELQACQGDTQNKMDLALIHHISSAWIPPPTRLIITTNPIACQMIVGQPAKRLETEI